MLLGGINRRLSPSTSVSGEFRGLQPESKPSFKQDLFMFTTLSPTARACAWSNILRSATAAALAAVCLVPLASQAQDAEIKMFAPVNGQRVGVGGFGWFVDLAIDFDVPLEQTGFTGFQLTGPGAHNNVPPMPGTFSPGRDDRMPGLIVLVSTATIGAQSCQNVANLFNLTGVTNREAAKSQLWDTWIVGAPNFGVNTQSTVYAAIAADKDRDGVFNDAPNVVPDADGNGICDEKDLKAFGLASNVRQASFFINP